MAETKTHDQLLTDRDVADALALPLTSVQTMFRTHQIPGFKLGRFWRIRKSDYDRWLRRKSA